MANENTVIEQANGTVTEPQETRTFTQEELNAIVADRINRERAKYSDYETLKGKAAKYDEVEEANKTELQKATERANTLQAQIDALTKEKELRDIREKVSQQTTVPATLLTGADEEACMAQAKAILEFAKPGSYPSVKDGGENAKPLKKDAVAQFGDWFAQALQ